MVGQPIRVLIVDDHMMVREGIRSVLHEFEDITVVGEAANGSEAIEMCERAAPDVALMDVRMPKMDGIEACRAISSMAARGLTAARVMMLTTFDLDDYVHSALRAGASGFMLKDAPAEQLVAAIRIIAAGEALLAPSVTRVLIDEIARRPLNQPDAFPGIDQLTERELEVVKLIARGMSNAEIATELYLGEATIKTHVGRILAKLGARDRVQTVVAAYESGLVTPGEPHPNG